jgi:formiminotetrahydrofolate cyclodeaminase
MALDDLLVAFSDTSPAPGGGGAAVVIVALSASLCAMAARLSTRQLDTASETVTEALSIRDEMVPLVDRDAESYRAVVALQRSPIGPDTAERHRALVDALSKASDVPMATVRAGARVARLAAGLAETGNPSLRGDAIVAAMLAGAGVEAAGSLVTINLAELPSDDRHGAVRSLVEETLGSVDRARRAAPQRDG